ncbi:unnamed protein product [Musa hybrid cultivar]
MLHGHQECPCQKPSYTIPLAPFECWPVMPQFLIPPDLSQRGPGSTIPDYRSKETLGFKIATGSSSVLFASESDRSHTNLAREGRDTWRKVPRTLGIKERTDRNPRNRSEVTQHEGELGGQETEHTAQSRRGYRDQETRIPLGTESIYFEPAAFGPTSTQRRRGR